MIMITSSFLPSQSVTGTMQGQRPSTTVFYRNPSCCNIADDDDSCDRSLNDMEAGFLRDHRLRRWSFVNGYPVKSPFLVSSPRYYGDEAEEEEMRGEKHFLDSCFLCEKTLRSNYDDIFMYRGDTPFCSEECRQEQIELDQQRERNMNLYSSLWNKEQKQEGRSNSPSKSPNRRLRTGTVAVA